MNCLLNKVLDKQPGPSLPLTQIATHSKQAVVMKTFHDMLEDKLAYSATTGAQGK